MSNITPQEIKKEFFKSKMGIAGIAILAIPHYYYKRGVAKLQFLRYAQAQFPKCCNSGVPLRNLRFCNSLQFLKKGLQFYNSSRVAILEFL